MKVTTRPLWLLFAATRLSSSRAAFVRPASSVATGLSSSSSSSSSSFVRRQMSASSSSIQQPDVSGFLTGNRPEGTEKYVMQQTMIRVKDPLKSLEFYCNVLGFKLIMYKEFPQWEFNVYFVAPVDAAQIPNDQKDRWTFCMNTPGCLELTWNYGSEQQEGKVYNTGNADATGTADGQKIKGGFGHIGITVPDVYEACARFAQMGCQFSKTPNAGGMKGLAFVLDPDGYMVEVLPQGEMVQKPVDHAGVAVDGGAGYQDNSK